MQVGLVAASRMTVDWLTSHGTTKAFQTQVPPLWSIRSIVPTRGRSDAAMLLQQAAAPQALNAQLRETELFREHLDQILGRLPHALSSLERAAG